MNAGDSESSADMAPLIQMWEIDRPGVRCNDCKRQADYMASRPGSYKPVYLCDLHADQALRRALDFVGGIQPDRHTRARAAP